MGLNVYEYRPDPQLQRNRMQATEVGAVVHDASVAMSVERQIEADMAAGNSWDAAADEPDRYAPLVKRSQVRMLQLLPLRPLL